MKITDIQVIRFRTTSRLWPTKWGYSTWGDEHEVTSSITKIITDEGVVGYNIGGDQATTDRLVKPLLVDENPLDREKLWQATRNRILKFAARCVRPSDQKWC
jgi:L-alanine-DL-glutamate epimerase-like enolase superfamily enzyme